MRSRIPEYLRMEGHGMTQEQWGPWIEHDGRGCPCVGMTVEVDHYHPFWGLQRGLFIERVHGDHGWSGRHDESNVIRYRIQKPRGLTILQRIAEQPKKERVEA